MCNVEVPQAKHWSGLSVDDVGVPEDRSEILPGKVPEECVGTVSFLLGVRQGSV